MSATERMPLVGHVQYDVVQKRKGMSWRAVLGLAVQGLFVAIAIAEVVLCAFVGFTVGVGVGVISLLWSSYAVAVVYPQFYHRLCSSAPIAPQLPFWLRLPIHLVSAFLYAWVLALFLVRIASPSPNVAAFPQACRGDTPNCTRVAASNVRGAGLAPPMFNTSAAAVQHDVLGWIETQPRATVLRSEPSTGFVHARFLSLLLGFPDDFYASVFCDGAAAVVWTQSQARLGSGDSGVNNKRVTEFLVWLKRQSFGSGAC
eukprot:a341698_20.p1 GENE.a341698_20~~a341698_20.p1  ORF type:complete len:268 (+),score=74.48 a341698_20:32-805(+)